jgi:hypothetical protein
MSKNHDKNAPLHANVVFRLLRGFKGRFNSGIATDWLRTYLDKGTLPAHVEIRSIDWRNAKANERPWKSGDPETVLKESSKSFRNFLRKKIIRVKRISK